MTLTGSDIVRLSVFLGLSASEILRAIDFYVLPQGEETPDGLRRIPYVNTERGKTYLALRKMDGKSCVFLSDNLCLIHQIRPGVCVSFPFVFEDRGEETTWGLNAMKDICPGLNDGPQVELSTIEKISSTVLEELALYREFADEWNTTQEDPTALGVIETILSDHRFLI